MRPTSRPLRFFWVLLTLWGTGRGLYIWHEWAIDAQPAPLATHVKAVVAARAKVPPPYGLQLISADTSKGVMQSSSRMWPMSAQHYAADHARLPSSTKLLKHEGAAPTALALEKISRMLPEASSPYAAESLSAQKPAKPLAAVPITQAPSSMTQSPRRLTISAWSLVRANGAPSLSDAGELGGSQAGVRAYYRLTPALSVTGRLSAPLGAPLGKEAALGFALKPLAGLPITVIAERRIALDHGGRNDWELLVAGGISERRLGRHFTLSGYLQAGLVGIPHPDNFVDGAIEVEHALVQRNVTRLTIGAGAWGGAQSNGQQAGLARLDIGPEGVLHTRVAEVGLRLVASYRFRVAGNTHPSSGPTLSLGGDF